MITIGSIVTCLVMFPVEDVALTEYVPLKGRVIAIEGDRLAVDFRKFNLNSNYQATVRELNEAMCEETKPSR